VLPPYLLSGEALDEIRELTRKFALELGVVGLINIQFAVRGEEVFVLEANPRASRTVPFVSKATATPLAKAAARVMVGATLAQLRDEGLLPPPTAGGHVAVKEAVLPFGRFPEVDSVLGPEMRSTGEVMGIDASFGLAFAKSQIAAGDRLPEGGAVFLSLADRDKRAGVVAARRFAQLGFSLVATAGTATYLEAHGVGVDTVVDHLSSRRDRDTAVELLGSGKVDLVVNTPRGRGPRADGDYIRRAAAVHRVPCLTTVAAALAAAHGMAEWAATELRVRSLQEYHAEQALPFASHPEVAR
jgi:carbamoyl-phosphate synthase large subunit